MTRLLFLLLFFIFAAPAFALQPIYYPEWNKTVAVSQKMESACDCVTTDNFDGSYNVNVRFLYIRYILGTNQYCHKMNPSDFFRSAGDGWAPLFNLLLGSQGGTVWSWPAGDSAPPDIDSRCLQ